MAIDEEGPVQRSAEFAESSGHSDSVQVSSTAETEEWTAEDPLLRAQTLPTASSSRDALVSSGAGTERRLLSTPEHQNGEGTSTPSYAPPSHAPPTPLGSLSQSPLTTKRGSAWPPTDLIGNEATDSFAQPSSSIVRTPTAVVEHGYVYPPDQVLYSIRCSPVGTQRDAVTANSPSASSAESDHQLRQLSEEDFVRAKPWPNAFFSPRTMQWVVWAPASEFVVDPAPTPQGSTWTDHAGLASLPLYESTEHDQIPAGKQKAAMKVAVFPSSDAQAGRSSAPFEGPFKSHHDVTTGRHFLSAQVPSSIDAKWLTAIKNDRRNNPPPGQGGDDAFLAAMKVLVRILINASRNDTRSLPLASQTIRNKLVYDASMAKVLTACGMYTDTSGEQDALRASSNDQDLTLRNLIEVVTWFEFNKVSSSQSLDTATVGFTAYLDRVDPYDFACALLGWRKDFALNEGGSQHDGAAYGQASGALRLLGATEHCSDAVIERVYFVNKRRQPDAIFASFGALQTIWQKLRPRSEALAILVARERSRGLCTLDDVRRAFAMLGLAVEPGLKGETSFETIRSAHYVARSRASQTQQLDKVRAVQEHLRTVALFRGLPPELSDIAAEEVVMTLDQAYETLGTEEATDDELVTVVYSCHLTDFQNDPPKLATLHEALTVIARHRNSSLLKGLAGVGNTDTGSGVSQSISAVTPSLDGLGSRNLPAGLNNIGNTCYLNSVLQYFFALKPLREAVLSQQWQKQGPAVDKDDKETVAELHATAESGQGNHRPFSVGGRMVSEYEVKRSCKFAALLAQLFDAMITSPAAAVTPERELAYLALVSARAEEVDWQSSEPLVASPPNKSPISSHIELPSSGNESTTPSSLTPSKQARVHDEPGMDSQKKAEAKLVEVALDRSSGETRSMSLRQDSDASMHETSVDPSRKRQIPSPPPIPPRPTAGTSHAVNAEAVTASQANETPAQDGRTGTDTPRQAERRNSLMKLGAQQDVSECLDNVLFQFEVALGSTKASPSAAEGTAGVSGIGSAAMDAAKLFTGKTRQRVSRYIAPSATEPTAPDSMCEPDGDDGVKEEIFTILPIEVIEEEGRDIYDGLDGFFDSEVLQAAGTGASEGQKDAHAGDRAVSSLKRTVTLLEPPPVLQIQLQRVQFDRKRGAFKSQAHLAAYEEIFLDRYLDPSFNIGSCDDALEREGRERKRMQAASLRRQINKVRDRVALLSGSDVSSGSSPSARPLKASEVLDKTAIALTALRSAFATDSENCIEQQPARLCPSDLPDFLREEARSVEREVEECAETVATLKRQNEELWTQSGNETPQRLKYHLMSVFMHRGEATHGHYFLNQRCSGRSEDMQGDAQWFKYNDNVVSSARVEDVLRDTTGATPYLLCYVREDLVNGKGADCVFETLCRRLDGASESGALGTQAGADVDKTARPEDVQAGAEARATATGSEAESSPVAIDSDMAEAGIK
ncbi:unnamed protein product [Parajaminaea phylloscopi]